MKPTLPLRLFLVLSGAIAAYVGASLLVDPAAFHAQHAIELAADPSTMSEARAPGGGLLGLGTLMVLGAFLPALTLTATVTAATVYLSYGAARLVGLALDGTPHRGLVLAAAGELLFGALAALFLLRAARRRRVRASRRALTGPGRAPAAALATRRGRGGAAGASTRPSRAHR